MNSLTAFAKRCAGLIEQHTPFLAYRHSEGYMVLILDAGERTEYTVSYRCYLRNGNARTMKEKTTDPKRLQELLDRPGAEVVATNAGDIPRISSNVTVVDTFFYNACRIQISTDTCYCPRFFTNVTRNFYVALYGTT